jgi:hypothetical protein
MAYNMSVPPQEFYNRSACLNLVNHTILNDPGYVSRNPQFFFSTHTAKNPVLTLEGCYTLCGPKWGPYPDNGARVLGWILPVVLLLTNVHLPPIGKKRFLGKRRFLTILHILGDPIGATWWHLKTIKVWGDCYREASDFLKKVPKEIAEPYGGSREAITVVFAAAARFMEAPELSGSFEGAIESITDEKLDVQVRADRFHALRKAGAVLADFQVNDMRRTVLAFLLYVMQVVSDFVPALGAGPNPSGGRVSPAMLLIWLVPIALLSNAIGDTASWRQSEHILVSLLKDMGAMSNGHMITEDIDFEVLNRAVIAPQFSERRVTSRISQHQTSYAERTGLLATLSVAPVLVAFTISFAVDDTAPTWFSCRGIFNIFAIVGWLLSALITAILLKLNPKLSTRLSIIILAKDLLVGGPIMIMVLLSTCGYFNSCYCSSGIIRRGRLLAHVDLVPDWAFPHNAKVYEACVAVGLGFQVIFFAGVVAFWFGAFKSIWWIEPRGAHSLAERSPKGVQETPSDAAIEARPSEKESQAEVVKYQIEADE